MNIRRTWPAFCAAVAVFISAGIAAHEPPIIVKPAFGQTLRKLPGKLLVVVEGL